MGRMGLALGSIALIAMLTSQPVLAGPYSDELADCLVRSTSDADKSYLVTWLFAAAALHPAVSSIASVSDAKRDELNRNAAKIVERLLTESCRSETRNALKHEGSGAFEQSFRVLGQVAGRQLFSDPAVAKSITDFANYLDQQKLKALAPQP